VDTRVTIMVIWYRGGAFRKLSNAPHFSRYVYLYYLHTHTFPQSQLLRRFLGLFGMPAASAQNTIQNENI